jgi:hypothetical protein
MRHDWNVKYGEKQPGWLTYFVQYKSGTNTISRAFCFAHDQLGYVLVQLHGKQIDLIEDYISGISLDYDKCKEKIDSTNRSWPAKPGSTTYAKIREYTRTATWVKPSVAKVELQATYVTVLNPITLKKYFKNEMQQQGIEFLTKINYTRCL